MAAWPPRRCLLYSSGEQGTCPTKYFGGAAGGIQRKPSRARTKCSDRVVLHWLPELSSRLFAIEHPVDFHPVMIHPAVPGLTRPLQRKPTPKRFRSRPRGPFVHFLSPSSALAEEAAPVDRKRSSWELPPSTFSKLISFALRPPFRSADYRHCCKLPSIVACYKIRALQAPAVLKMPQMSLFWPKSETMLSTMFRNKVGCLGMTLVTSAAFSRSTRVAIPSAIGAGQLSGTILRNCRLRHDTVYLWRESSAARAAPCRAPRRPGALTSAV